MLEPALRASLFLISGWAVARLLLPGLLSMIDEAGFRRPNYRGEEIPNGAGAVFFLSTLVVVTFLFFVLPSEARQKAAVFLFALAGFTCLGLMDDFWGSGSCRGLAGHLKSLVRGRLTTGALKALAGGVMALFIAASGGSPAYVPLDALIIALSVNLINLLDLRPGRAGKCFLLVSAAILAAFPGRAEGVFLAAAAGSLLAFLPTDLGARAMMGDTGANALGAAAGITAAWTFSPEMKAALLALLLALHLVAERYSLTRIIQSVPLLDYLDRLGRK